MQNHFFGRNRGQGWGALLESRDFMFSLLRTSRRLVLWGLLASATGFGQAQVPLPPLGEEYLVAGSFPGDQVFAQVGLTAAGGYVVWHDNFMDGDGSGIGARRLDRNSAAVLGAFRINTTTAGEQEFPRIAMFPDGGAVVVWQGGPLGRPKVFARFLAADGTFATGEIQVNTFANGRQEHPAVAVLSNGSAVVVWTSFGQDGSLAGVYGQRLSSKGEKLGSEFQVNERTELSQRDPAVASLSDGRFVVVWVSEKQNAVGTSIPGQEGVAITGPGTLPPPYDVSIFARVFDSAGAVADEFKVNSSTFVCANPVVSTGPTGGFLVAWSVHVGRVEVSNVMSAHAWDVRARAFGLDLQPTGVEFDLNEWVTGDQILPCLTAIGSDYLAAWVSMGQDGSREGIYARLVSSGGVPRGSEFRVNTRTAGSQKLPALASDGAGRCLAVWSGARGGVASYDVFAQRFAIGDELRAPSKPIVLALSASKLSVTWPSLTDLGVTSYELYVDGNAQPVVLADNYYILGQLPAGSTHTFALAYVLGNGRHSPISEAGSGATWGEDANFDGLPDDWQIKYWGADSANWPLASADSDKDGATNVQEFLAGTDPTDSAKVLRLTWRHTEQGSRLEWTTEKGCIYQVQTSVDLKKWDSVGSPRFAAGTIDSIPASREKGKAMYRVIRVR